MVALTALKFKNENFNGARLQRCALRNAVFKKISSEAVGKDAVSAAQVKLPGCNGGQLELDHSARAGGCASADGCVVARVQQIQSLGVPAVQVCALVDLRSSKAFSATSCN